MKVRILLAVLAGLIVGIVSMTAMEADTHKESGRDIVLEHIIEAQSIPTVTQEDLRRRLWTFLAAAQLVRDADKRAFTMSKMEAGHYRDLIRTLATMDAEHLLSKQMREMSGSNFLFLSEMEENYYRLYHVVDQLGITCGRQEDGSNPCELEDMRIGGEHSAELLLTEKGGLIDQLRANQGDTQLARRINRLVMRWRLWEKLKLTGEERVLIATS